MPSLLDFNEAERIVQPSKTYALNLEKGSCAGTLDGKEALRQSILLRLLTVQGEYPIYSAGYGVPMHELIGQSIPLVYVSIAAAIRQTLLEDDRVTGVSDFVFDTDRKNVTVSFRVQSIFGDVTVEEEPLNV